MTTKSLKKWQVSELGRAPEMHLVESRCERWYYGKVMREVEVVGDQIVLTSRNCVQMSLRSIHPHTSQNDTCDLSEMPGCLDRFELSKPEWELFCGYSPQLMQELKVV